MCGAHAAHKPNLLKASPPKADSPWGPPWGRRQAISAVRHANVLTFFARV
ncbi:hypothetical protein PVL29_017685 [Vitis rotundifolia]|uniref:Uncharacterized protein n=1 Tax=Vitis rotundifolia TaxID=103349 RepID=A0AA38ZBC0_VITRO|nr:hypothetical protein PVL29_017685 [Vitis rotundifolia]